MTVVPEERGRGFGERIISGAIREAARRADRTALLEVFEHNTPAVNPYTGLGSRPLRRLVGYSREPGGAAPDAVDMISGGSR
jgi:ribosomal protein S18 acetylase RimI-like enzyme